MQMRLEELRKEAMVSVVLPWPGKSAKDMFKGDEVLRTRAAVKPVMLYPSLSRLFGYKYMWMWQARKHPELGFTGKWTAQADMYPEFHKKT
jgi:hypothetical protein